MAHLKEAYQRLEKALYLLEEVTSERQTSWQQEHAQLNENLEKTQLENERLYVKQDKLSKKLDEIIEDLEVLTGVGHDTSSH